MEQTHKGFAPEPDVTRLLADVADGVPGAQSRLLECVYDELRSIARQQRCRNAASDTLQATALVHEAYVRIFKDRPPSYAGRRHFFGAAALTMKRILLDQARRHGRIVHGGGRSRVPFDGLVEGTVESPQGLGALAEEVVLLSEAVDALEEVHPEAAEVLLLKHFGGLSEQTVAEVTGLSASTVTRRWAFARAFVQRHMKSRIS